MLDGGDVLMHRIVIEKNGEYYLKRFRQSS